MSESNVINFYKPAMGIDKDRIDKVLNEVMDKYMDVYGAIERIEMVGLNAETAANLDHKAELLAFAASFAHKLMNRELK